MSFSLAVYSQRTATPFIVTIGLAPLLMGVGS